MILLVVSPGCISIHALREEGDFARSLPRPREKKISIHALREEGDILTTIQSRLFSISIHALREEGDHRQRQTVWKDVKFLSTPSARRATELF